VEQHQREQPQDLRLVRHERGEDPRQPDRLRRQLATDQPLAGARVIAFVEDEVEDSQHAIESLWQRVVGRDPIRDSGVADLALGPHESLGERRLRNEEGPGDLRRREATQRAQRERNAGVYRQRRMATGEDQPQPIIRDRAHAGFSFDDRVGVDCLELGLDGRFALEELLLLGERPPTPDPVDRPVPGGRRDPCPGVVGYAASRPRLERGEEGLLDRLLGEIEVTQDADQGCDRPALLLAEDAVDDGVRIGCLGHAPGRQPLAPAAAGSTASPDDVSQTGRTSIEPSRAPGIFAASSIASSRSRASIR
jgi:hypothetical protein